MGGRTRVDGVAGGRRCRGPAGVAVLSIAAASAVGLFAGGARAQDPAAAGTESAGRPPLAGNPTLPEVTVEAQRKTIQRRVDAFVWQMTRRSAESLGRWNVALCPMAAGLSREQGEFVLARLSQIATAAGAPLAGPQCEPNLYIVVTQAPEPLLRAWHARDARLFGDGYLYGDGHQGAISRFLATSRPVRIWYNVTFGSGSATTFGAASDIPGMAGIVGGVRGTHAYNATRLKWNEVRGLQSVIVIVEPARVRGVPLAVLVDYVAMAALSEIDLDAKLGDAPTILRLFEPAQPSAQRPAGLSRWDQAYLKALYHTDQKDLMQRSAVERDVLTDVAP